MSKTDVRVKLNKMGVRSMLKSSDMQEVLQGYAIGIAQRCGEGYAIDAHTGKTRVNVSVRPRTKKAIKDNNENNTILKNLKG